MVVAAMLLAAVGLAAPARAVASGSLTPGSGSVVVTYSGFVGDPYVNICPSSTGSGACQGLNRSYFLTTASGFASLGPSPYTVQEGTIVYVGTAGSTTVALPAGTYRTDLFDSGTNSLVASEVVTIGNGGSSPNASSAPPPIIQEFGKPASGTCDVAEPEGLNWAGVSSGGWGESWAGWMNDGAGGAVCTRTLVYSSSLGHWVVG